MQRTHHYFVYLLASKAHGTRYTGVTNDLRRRFENHRNGTIRMFTRRLTACIASAARWVASTRPAMTMGFDRANVSY